jgi:hypothetical protein
MRSGARDIIIVSVFIVAIGKGSGVVKSREGIIAQTGQLIVCINECSSRE